MSLSNTPIQNFSQLTSQGCKNNLRDYHLPETGTVSMRCYLALNQSPAYPMGHISCSNLEAIQYSRLALCPLNCFMAALVSSGLHHRIIFLVKIHLSLAFSLLHNYQAIFSLPGTQTKESRELTLHQQLP